MIVKIDHIGIAVNNVEDAVKIYCDVLGVKAEDIKRELVKEETGKAAMIPVGESRIELMESTDPQGVIAKHIARRGEGMHHLSLEVSNIQDELETLKGKGVPLVDMEPRIGVGGTKVVFIHPKATKVLIELVEH